MSQGRAEGRARRRSGSKGSSQVHWNLSVPALYEEAVTPPRRRHLGRRPARLQHRPAHRPLAQRQVHRHGALERGARRVGQGQPTDRRRVVRRRARAGCWRTCAARSCSCRTAGPAPIRRTGCRSASSPRRAWHNLFARHMFIPEPDAAKRAAARAAVHGHRHSELHGDARRSDKTNSEVVHPPELREEARPHRRHELRRRDQEVDLHGHELPAAAPRRDADALLGERRRGRRRGAVLRAVRHGQDHALERPESAADRRRRARVERGRRVQLRRRLLREDDPALGRGRAADLRDDTPVRHGPRERGVSIPKRARSISTTTR